MLGMHRSTFVMMDDQSAQSLTLDFGVGGMSCAGCASRAEKALKGVDGVTDAHVDFATERARVSLDSDSAGEIAKATEDAGFLPETSPIDLDIGGMTCAGCAGSVEKALNAVPGVVSASVNLALEQAQIKWLGASFSTDALVQAVKAAGYQATPRATQADLRREQARIKSEADARQLKIETCMLGIAAALTAPLFLMMILPPLGGTYHVPAWLQILLCAPVQFWIGARFYVGAWKALKAKSANMDVLVALGTSAAFALSVWVIFRDGFETTAPLYFEASAIIITLIVAGKLIETRAKRGTTQAIRTLMALRPEQARVRRSDVISEIPIEDVVLDDIVIVRPGERIPVDGAIIEGHSENDEQLITGESMPVARTIGDPVVGGAVNGAGELHVRVSRVGEDTTLAKIVRLVENAQSGKAPIQRLVDKVSAVFVPIVIGIAITTFSGWIFAGANLETAIINAVSVLVIACPCALGLATPTAIVAGTGAAARAGILIKDVGVLERAYGVAIVAFDKTGTLTRGEPVLTDAIAINGSEDDLLSIASSVQSSSEHPLARAVLNAASDRKLSYGTAQDVTARVGLGVEGIVDGQRVSIGNRQMMDDAGIDFKQAASLLDEMEADGKTAVMVAVGDTVRGVFGIRDEIREQSLGAVRALAQQNIRTLMLSGDAMPVAEAISKTLGIDDARGELKPDQKVAALKEIQDGGHLVAMVGDGINDAPALAQADVGIAMGSGSDAAMESAAITLMRPDPRLVAAAFDIARATWNRIKWNLFWAFAFNAIGLPLAAAGYLSPAVAGGAMALSSICVVSSSLLLRGWMPQQTGEMS